MENWNPGYNWTVEQFAAAIRRNFLNGKDYICLNTEHNDWQNLAEMKAWAEEAGYYAEERAGGDMLMVSKKPIEKAEPEGFVYAGSSAPSDGTGKFMRLLKLLKKAVPQAEKYWICTANGKIVCQVGDGQLLPSKEEQKGIQSALADFRKVDDRFREMVCDRQMAYGNSLWDTQDKAYYAFPLRKNAKDFEHVLVCWGDHDEIYKVRAAYQLVSNLYMLRQ